MLEMSADPYVVCSFVQNNAQPAVPKAPKGRVTLLVQHTSLHALWELRLLTHMGTQVADLSPVCATACRCSGHRTQGHSHRRCSSPTRGGPTRGAGAGKDQGGWLLHAPSPLLTHAPSPLGHMPPHLCCYMTPHPCCYVPPHACMCGTCSKCVYFAWE